MLKTKRFCSFRYFFITGLTKEKIVSFQNLVLQAIIDHCLQIVTRFHNDILFLFLFFLFGFSLFSDFIIEMSLQVNKVFISFTLCSTSLAVNHRLHLSLKISCCQVCCFLWSYNQSFGLRLENIEQDLCKFWAIMLLETHSKKVRKLYFDLTWTDMRPYLTKS